jgi:hypothetical protein
LWAAIGLLYTNLPVAASQQGILPKAAGAAVPLLLVVIVAHQALIRRRQPVVDRTFHLMLAFLAVLVASTWYAAEGPDLALQRIGVYASEGLLLYFLVRNAVRTPRDLRRAMQGVVVASAFLGAVTTYQAATGTYGRNYAGLAEVGLIQDGQLVAVDPSEVQGGIDTRARGPVGDPNRFAQILLMAAPLALVLAVVAPTRKEGAVMLACGGLILAGVFLTYSRGGFLALVILTVLTLPLGLVRMRTLLPLALAGVLAVPAVVPGYADRVASLVGVAGLFGHAQVQPDQVTRGRTTEMLAALAAYVDHPVLGVGPGQYLAFHSVRYQALPEISLRELAVPRRAHDLYVEVAAESGTIGLLVFMAIPLLLLSDLLRLRREMRPRRPDLARVAGGFVLAIVSYLGTGVFLHLALERYWWFMVALAAAAVGVLRRSAQAHPGAPDGVRSASRSDPAGWGSLPLTG